MSNRSKNHPSEDLTRRYTAEARSYVDYWSPVLHPISCRFIEELPEQVARRVLDLGSGAGTLLPILGEKFEGARVYGVDRSEGMLSLADSDAPLAVMDALGLGVKDAVFDVVVMAFVLFHLPDPIDGLREIRRILRPGGLVGVTTWANDAECTAGRVWKEELDAHGATPPEALGRIAQHDLMDSTEKVEGLLDAAGFQSVRAEVRGFSHRMEPDDFLGLKTTVGGSRQRLESLTDDNRQRCLTRARERLADLTADDYVMEMEIIFASARSPG